MADRDQSNKEKFETDSGREISKENIFGLRLKIYRPIGIITGLIFGLLSLGYLIELRLGLFFFTLIVSTMGFSMTVSKEMKDNLEELWNELEDAVEDDEFEEVIEEKVGGNLNEGEVRVCRECRQKVDSDVKRCPHCGWKPTKKGGLWWGASGLLTLLNPITALIGVPMAAKGAKDKHNASKGVWETESGVGEGDGQKENEQETKKTSNLNTIESLERLDSLRERGAITDEEFNQMKDEILDGD